MGDSQSNGTAENAVERVIAQARTIKCGLENRLGESIGKDSNILPWLISYAGATISLFSVGQDGLT